MDPDPNVSSTEKLPPPLSSLVDSTQHEEWMNIKDGLYQILDTKLRGTEECNFMDEVISTCNISGKNESDAFAILAKFTLKTLETWTPEEWKEYFPGVHRRLKDKLLGDKAPTQPSNLKRKREVDDSSQQRKKISADDEDFGFLLQELDESHYNDVYNIAQKSFNFQQLMDAGLGENFSESFVAAKDNYVKTFAMYTFHAIVAQVEFLGVYSLLERSSSSQQHDLSTLKTQLDEAIREKVKNNDTHNWESIISEPKSDAWVALPQTREGNLNPERFPLHPKMQLPNEILDAELKSVQSLTCLLSISGSGKTAALLRFLSKQTGIYSRADIGTTDSSDRKDDLSINLITTLETLSPFKYWQVVRKCLYIADLIRIRWVYWMKQVHGLSHSDMIVCQTNGNTRDMADIFTEYWESLCTLDSAKLQKLIKLSVQELLSTDPNPQSKLYIVRDESQQLLQSKLVTLSANMHIRPILSLQAALYARTTIPICCIFSGTGLQSDVQTLVESSLAKFEVKQERSSFILGIPYIQTPEEAFNFIKLHVDLCKIYPSKQELELQSELSPFLPVRRRFFINVVLCLHQIDGQVEIPSLEAVCQKVLKEYVDEVDFALNALLPRQQVSISTSQKDFIGHIDKVCKAAVLSSIVRSERTKIMPMDTVNTFFTCGFIGPSTTTVIPFDRILAQRDTSIQCDVTERILLEYAREKRGIKEETAVASYISGHINPQGLPEAHRRNLESLACLAFFPRLLRTGHTAKPLLKPSSLTHNISFPKCKRSKRKKISIEVKEVRTVTPKEFNDILVALEDSTTRTPYIGVAFVDLPQSCHVDALIVQKKSLTLLSMKRCTSSTSQARHMYYQGWLSVHPLLVSCDNYATPKKKGKASKILNDEVLRQNNWKSLHPPKNPAFRQLLAKEKTIIAINVFVGQDVDTTDCQWKQFHEVVQQRCVSAGLSIEMPPTHFYTMNSEHLRKGLGIDKEDANFQRFVEDKT